MILNVIKQLIYPTYTLPTGNVYERRATEAPAQRVKKDSREVYVGKTADGAPVTTLRFEWDAQGNTDFVPVTAHHKGRKIGSVEPGLTPADLKELAGRKPRLSSKAAETLKRAYAEAGGAITAKEMAMQTRYSLAYAEVAKAAFTAALSE